jgi:transposase
MAVAETPLVKKNHQISVAVNQKIAQLLIENQAMKHIAHSYQYFNIVSYEKAQ